MEKNCLAGDEEQPNGKCREGSSGPLCGFCETGYFKADKACTVCKEGTSNRLYIMAPIAVLAVVLAWKTYTRTRSRRYKSVSHSAWAALTSMIDAQRAKIAWQTIQITSSIAWTTSIKWPEPFRFFSELLTKIAQLNLVPFDCIAFNLGYWHELLIVTIVPVSLVALAWLTASLVPQTYTPQKKAMTFTLFVAFVVLPMVSTKIFRTYLCLEFDDGTRFLDADLSISCDDTAYTIMTAWATCTIAIYPVGIPLMFFVVLRSNRKVISSRDDSLPCPAEVKHISMLFNSYTSKSMYWEVVESVRRLLLSSLVVFMGTSSSARTTWGALLAIVFAVVCAEVQPCSSPTTQGFAFMTQWLVVTHFLLAVILAAGFGLFSPSVVGVLFVILTLFVILGAFAHQVAAEEFETTKQTHGGLRSAKMISAQPCVMICDPGRTVDSELALALLRVLRDLGHIEPKAFIANMWPQEDRSHLLRKRLDSFGLHDVPVGVGTSGGAIKTDTAIAEKLRALGEDPAFAGKSDRASEIVPGGQLLQTTWDNAAPASLVLLLTSSLKVCGCRTSRALL
jgi:hypothetical protein